MLSWTLAVLVVLVVGLPATADPTWSPTTAPSVPIPVAISRLFTQLQSHPLSDPAQGGAFWVTCVDFTNASTRSIVAIQFKLTYIDAFDTLIATLRGDRVGLFSPGILIQGPPDLTGVTNPDQRANCWDILVVAGSLSKITAEVVKVRYSGGEIWTADPSSPHQLFSATYLAGPGFVDPPSSLVCHLGLLTLKENWAWVEQHGHAMSKIIGCVQNWERQHGNLAGWPTPPPEPSPAPTSSPGS